MGANIAIPKARIKTGSYTGNGGATQAITGVGFQPTFVTCMKTDGYVIVKNEGMGLNANNFAGTYGVNMIISFDADGFTVGNAAGMNALGNTIFYLAIRKT